MHTERTGSRCYGGAKIPFFDPENARPVLSVQMSLRMWTQIYHTRKDNLGQHRRRIHRLEGQEGLLSSSLTSCIIQFRKLQLIISASRP